MTDFPIPPLVDIAKQIRDLECDRAVLTNIVLMLAKRLEVREFVFPLEEVAAIGTGHIVLIDQVGTTTIVRLGHKSERH